MIVCDIVTSWCMLVSVQKRFLVCCSFCYVGTAVEVPPLYQLYQTLCITWKLSRRRISFFSTRGPVPPPRKRSPATQSGRKRIRSVHTCACDSLTIVGSMDATSEILVSRVCVLLCLLQFLSTSCHLSINR